MYYILKINYYTISINYTFYSKKKKVYFLKLTIEYIEHNAIIIKTIFIKIYCIYF